MVCGSIRLAAFCPLPVALAGWNGARSTARARCRHWSGLSHWRESPPSEHRAWGPDGPQLVSPDQLPSGPPSSLAEWGALVLSTPDPIAKSRLSHAGFSSLYQDGIPIGICSPPDCPARPLRPLLVTQKEVPPPKESGLPLNAYMLHGLAHVELNAIDLAWDTVVRFSPHRAVLGDVFFMDFARVADDESRHFLWCHQRLSELGFSYGDMPAHNLLWRECARSSGDVAARLAVIPMVQEARGLDAGPRLVKRLLGFNDKRSSKIVAKISEEEVAHVAVGVFWFISVCEKMGKAPRSAFRELLEEYKLELKGPFNHPAREEAGIPRDWYDRSYSSELNDGLSEVHNRLASIIAMEKRNSNLES